MMWTESFSALLWMGLPVLGGYLLWQSTLCKTNDGEDKAASLARILALFGIVVATPPMLCLIFWVNTLSIERALLLSTVGVCVQGSGSLTGWLIGRWARLPAIDRASFFLGGASSNVLTFGGITVVLLLSSPEDPYAEISLADLMIYRLLESPYYYVIAWPLAASIAGADHSGPVRFREYVRDAVRGPNMAPIVGIVAGVALSLAGVPRPEMLDGIAEILVKLAIVVLGISVGIGLRRAAPLRHLKACLCISAIKFLLMPLVAISMALLLGFDGRSLQVILIAACMPVAFMAVVGATLYRLDVELVGSFWVFTTTAMIVVVPVLSAIIGLIAK